MGSGSRPSLPALNRPPPPSSWTRDPGAAVFPLTIRPSSSRCGLLLPPAGPFYRLTLFNDMAASLDFPKQKRPPFRRPGTSCAISAPFFLATGRIPPGTSTPFLLPKTSSSQDANPGYPPQALSRPTRQPRLFPADPSPFPTKQKGEPALAFVCAVMIARLIRRPPDPP